MTFAVSLEDELSWSQGPVTISEETPTSSSQPQFSSNRTGIVFAPRGGTASLECHVSNLGDSVVSWVKLYKQPEGKDGEQT